MRLGAFLIVMVSVAGVARGEPRTLEPALDTGTHKVLRIGTTQRTAETAENSHISKILYVNGCWDGGCTLTPGDDNAITNSTSLIEQASVLSEFDKGQEFWDATIECVRTVYKPYNIQIVTEDPGAVPHHEAIAAGHAAEVNWQGALGVAPSICDPRNNVISFSFANDHDGLANNPLHLCWTIAQESAHAYGLEHAYDCSDAMTYLNGCMPKMFRDKNIQCQDSMIPPNPVPQCRCGGSAQNSHKWLIALFGPGEGADAPVVTFTTPAANASVMNGFPIQVETDDIRGTNRAELYLNGWPIDTQEVEDDTYTFRAPMDFSDGVIHIEVRVYNDVGIEGVATRTVTKGSPCGSNADCKDGVEECTDGACIFVPGTGAKGDPCEDSYDCASMLCGTLGGESYCTEDCNPFDETSCGDGFDCLNTNASEGVCWPAGDDGETGGCCSVAPSKRRVPVAPLLLTLLVGAALVLSRRRR